MVHLLENPRVNIGVSFVEKNVFSPKKKMSGSLLGTV